MFRKIHSNRNPKDTLLSELRKEFAVYISSADQKLLGICNRYPKQVYTAMVLLIVISFVLSLNLFRSQGPTQKPLKKPETVTAPLSDGFSEISSKAAALRESLALKTKIESLIAKDSLDHQDSVTLEKSIDKFHDLSIANTSQTPLR